MFHFHREEKEGFTIDVYATDEHCSPVDLFEDAEIIEKINNGQLEWFCAKVTASKNGIILADDYLGGCCYERFEDFINPNCYYGDMVNTVIEEAKQAIIDLNK